MVRVDVRLAARASRHARRRPLIRARLRMRQGLTSPAHSADHAEPWKHHLLRSHHLTGKFNWKSGSIAAPLLDRDALRQLTEPIQDNIDL
jgi:hypothetical protein